MTTNGRIEDLVRQFMILPKETRREYSIAVGERDTHFAKLTIWRGNLVSGRIKCENLTEALFGRSIGIQKQYFAEQTSPTPQARS